MKHTMLMIIIVTLMVTQWQGASSINTLESTPPAVNRVLTVFAGQQISLTCSHELVVTGATRWIASPPIDCLTTVSHIGINPLTHAPPCGPFTFQEITPLEPVTPTLLNSTAVATATVNMTGTSIECRGGNAFASFSVGNISLSVVYVAPTPIVEAQIYCTNSSDLTTVALSWMFPSHAPPGIVYPPVDELRVTILVSNASGLISNTTFPASQSYAFFHLRNDANYTVSVEANNDNTASPSTVQLQLTTLIYTVDTSMAFQDGEVIIRLNDRCKEDPTSFMTTLSHGSCPNSLQHMTSKVFNSSGVASFKLDIENVTGNVCIQVETTHQSRPNTPLHIFEQELTLNMCSVASINSVTSSSVTVEFSLAEKLGEVPHGTVATFKPLMCADQLVGVDHATCFNGMWSDLSHHTSSSPLSTSEAVVITFVLSTISALIVGAITSSLITYCIINRRASKHPATDQSKGALYEEVSQPKISDKVFEMGENIAYGPVQHKQESA